MNVQEVNMNKNPIILIDKSLDFFNDKVLFPKKLESANDMLKKIGLPDELRMNHKATVGSL